MEIADETDAVVDVTKTAPSVKRRRFEISDPPPTDRCLQKFSHVFSEFQKLQNFKLSVYVLRNFVRERTFVKEIVYGNLIDGNLSTLAHLD